MFNYCCMFSQVLLCVKSNVLLLCVNPITVLCDVQLLLSYFQLRIIEYQVDFYSCHGPSLWMCDVIFNVLC